MRRLRILTWHVHGSYLLYLTQCPHDFYVLSKPGRPPGYTGRHGHLPWGENVHDLPVDAARDREFDLLLFQDDPHYLHDQHVFLSAAQRALPRIYLEHDPPPDNPTDQRHPVDDPDTLLVHVTPFNRLMWDAGRTPTTVVEHGVLDPRLADPGLRYRGDLERGLVVINHLARRGRRLGADLYAWARETVPLNLVGMAAEEAGGLGEVLHRDLPAFSARYRFFYNPIRYTSMGLAVIEAMLVGLPVIGLATTEMATAVENGVAGFVDTDPDRLIAHMRRLLADPAEARRLGEGARAAALERFGIGRFVADWDRAFARVTG